MVENETKPSEETVEGAEAEEGQGRGKRGGRGGRGRRRDSNKPEFKGDGDGDSERQKPVYIGRVSKTVKGGKRFSIAALVVVGDGKGRVGYGKGKAREVQDAMRKATDQARRNMIRVPLREGRTIHHDVIGRFGSGRVFLRTAPAGTGIIAGGPMRAVLEVLGISDVVAKSQGSSNPHNMVRATIAALQKVSTPRSIAGRRNKKVNEIVDRKTAGADAI